jgi:DNA-binding XRE family transcriptional regulator
MARMTKPTTDAIKIINKRYFQGKPEMQALLKEARVNNTIARKIYKLRAKAGLTQCDLAKLIGTTASVICRLEDADYNGHSIAMLQRIAVALNKQIEIRFVAKKKKLA